MKNELQILLSNAHRDLVHYMPINLKRDQFSNVMLLSYKI